MQVIWRFEPIFGPELFENTIKVRALIKKECCNYDNGNCVLLDNGNYVKCPQVAAQRLMCGWFKKAVLPLDKILEIKIYGEKETVTENNKSNPRVRQKQCDICGKAFNSIARNTRHCPKCAEKVHNVQKAESKRKRRSMATK